MGWSENANFLSLADEQILNATKTRFESYLYVSKVWILRVQNWLIIFVSYFKPTKNVTQMRQYKKSLGLRDNRRSIKAVRANNMLLRSVIKLAVRMYDAKKKLALFQTSYQNLQFIKNNF